MIGKVKKAYHVVVGPIAVALLIADQDTVSFDGSNLSSGMYFIYLKAGQAVKLQKMTLIK